MYSHEKQFAVCSFFAIAAAVCAWESLLGSGPLPARAGAPGDGYACFSTPGPFWDHPCRCPVENNPHDFCSNARPQDGTEQVEYRICVPQENKSCDTIQRACGDRIWHCTFAHCSTPWQSPPSSWVCIETDKTGGCGDATYDWCDPVNW